VTTHDRRVVVAQYDWRLPGDHNDACMDNVLDLLYLQNRLQAKCSE